MSRCAHTQPDVYMSKECDTVVMPTPTIQHNITLYTYH